MFLMFLADYSATEAPGLACDKNCSNKKSIFQALYDNIVHRFPIETFLTRAFQRGSHWGHMTGAPSIWGPHIVLYFNTRCSWIFVKLIIKQHGKLLKSLVEVAENLNFKPKQAVELSS